MQVDSVCLLHLRSSLWQELSCAVAVICVAGSGFSQDGFSLILQLPLRFSDFLQHPLFLTDATACFISILCINGIFDRNKTSAGISNRHRMIIKLKVKK
jgi:hypothetical protein